MFTPAKRLIVMGRRYKNLLLNGNFALDSNSDGVSDNWNATSTGVATWVDGVQSFLPSAQWAAVRQNITLESTHKYYFAVLVKSISTGTFIEATNVESSGTAYHSGSGQFELLSRVVIGTGQSSVISILKTNLASGWTEIQAKSAILIDLTIEFAAGNEPDLTWCNANIPQNIIW